MSKPVATVGAILAFGLTAPVIGVVIFYGTGFVWTPFAENMGTVPDWAIDLAPIAFALVGGPWAGFHVAAAVRELLK